MGLALIAFSTPAWQPEVRALACKTGGKCPWIPLKIAAFFFFFCGKLIFKFFGKKPWIKGNVFGFTHTPFGRGWWTSLCSPFFYSSGGDEFIFCFSVLRSAVTPPVHFVTPKFFSILHSITLGSIKRMTVLRDFWTDCFIPVTAPGGLELWKLRVRLILPSIQMPDSEKKAFV